MSTSQIVQDAVRRLGLGDAAATDPFSKATISLLSTMTTQLEVALEEEGVNPETTERIIKRFIYGAMPNRADAELRLEAMSQRLADLESPDVVRLVPGLVGHRDFATSDCRRVNAPLGMGGKSSGCITHDQPWPCPGHD